ncbi:Pycsar system effector family protein [Micromonospora sp. NBC_01412]|uniref:Pycsar system effector family protein n=1 Tax=Micromonospora sp. NBC_01412 TaxID=2903590 RepID=UPI00324DD2D4
MEQEDPWMVLQHANDWLRHADTKASLILTLNGALIGLITLRVQTPGLFDRQPFVTALLLVATGLLAGSLAFNVIAVAPRSVVTDQQRSLLYFHHVATEFEASESSFVEEFTALITDKEALRRQVASLVWANSLVARRKYRHLNWGIRFTAGAILVIVCAGVLGALGG